MAQTEIVVALDIGTTKVCTLVGEVAGEDQIEILGVGLAPSTGMRKGVVVDIPATTAAIRDSVESAGRMAGVHIATVYVGVTGEHIASSNSRGGVPIPQHEITDEHALAARQAARQVTIPSDREVLHTIPRQYIVDGLEGVRYPVGMSASRLEVETHVVTGARTFIENVVKCVQRAHLEIDDLVVEPLATGLAVLTEAERQLGVVLADIGGGTTDVALFSDGAITHTSVIPIGGSQVSNDVEIGFRLTPEDAERLKVKHGAANADDIEPTDYVEVHMIGDEEPREIPRLLLPEIIGPRTTELFEQVREQVRAAAAGGLRVSTCVVSGGGSQLQGLTEVARDVLEMPVRVGKPRDVIDPKGLVDSPVFATAVGMLHYAAQRTAGRQRIKQPRSLASGAVRLMARWLRRLRNRGRSGP